MGCSSYRHDHLHPTFSQLLLLLVVVVVLVTARSASAQSPSNNPNNNNSNSNNPYFANANFNPSMAIVIVVLISAFFFLGFFSIYIRQCAGDRRDTSVAARSGRAAASARSRRQRGLDPEILASFPTLVYSDVRAHKIGKGFLECAVCLSEFDDDETLRLLPKCDHVFHPDCIDAWLAAHVTCPVCRCNLDEPAGPAEFAAEPPAQEPEPAPAPVQVQEDEHQVVIEMRPPEESTEEERMRRAEIDNLERFVNMKRARSRARPANFPRSHSTGHSLVLPGENLDRFTLRLPENIRRDLVQRAEMMKRTKSLVAFRTEGSSRIGYRGGEGSSRIGYRGGEGSIGKGRSIRLGRSDRWGSFLLRTLSTKMPNWGRRGDGVDGSTSMRGGGGGGGGIFRRGDSMKGEGSARGVRFNAVVSPFDCYGGGAAAKEEDSQSSTAALNRV